MSVNWDDYPNFEEREFTCRDGCGLAGMTAGYMMKLQDLRDVYDKPMLITSGFRCPKHNAAVSSTGAFGPHTTGLASDIAVTGKDAHRLLGIALDLDFSGIGIKQTGSFSGRFIHLDLLPYSERRPWVWSY